MFSLIDALPTAIVLIEDDRIVAWNGAATSLYGWSGPEVIGRPFRATVLDRDDRDAFDEVVAGVDGRGRWEGDFRVKRRDGVLLVSSFAATRITGPDGRPNTAWVVTDSIDQERSEQEREMMLSTHYVARRELESTVAVFEALLDSAPIGIAVLDLDLACTHSNSTFLQMIGAEKSPVGEFLDDLAILPPEVAADLRRVVTTGRSLIDRPLELKPDPASPTTHQISANYFPIFSHDHELTGAGLTWTDITNARLAEGERAALTRRASEAQRRLAVLASASSVLMTTTDVDALIDRLARVLAPSAAEWCVIELVDRFGNIAHAAVSHADQHKARRLRSSLIGQPADTTADSPIAIARHSGQGRLYSAREMPAVISRSARTPEQRALYDELGFRSGIVVPIRLRADTMGVLILSNSSDVSLDEEDLDVAVEIAHRAALAVGRAITYRNEHVLAGELQRALLPESLPDIDGATLEVRYSATADSATVGGDWYDAVQLSERQVLLSVGDVVGHDTRAAVGMSRLRYLITTFAVEGVERAGAWTEPHDILSRIDRVIRDDPTTWATCVVAALDTATLQLRWSNAGHPPPLLVRDGMVRTIEARSEPMLGVAGARPRTTNQTQLFDGDRVLFYTDGLFERRREHIDVGLARLADATRRLRSLDVGRFCDEIIREMFADRAQSDDMALLAVDVTTPQV